MSAPDVRPLPSGFIYLASPRHNRTEERPCSQGTSTFAPRYGLDLHSFDEEYVRDLTEGKPEIERHFTAYFGNLILIKLRSRRLPAHVIEDIRQETFLRVFVTLRRKQGLQHPERLWRLRELGLQQHLSRISPVADRCFR